MGNDIEEIKKLYAEVKTYKIPHEVKDGETQLEFKIKALSLEDMGLLDFKENMSLSELAICVKKLFAKSLEIKEEDAGKISFKYMEDLLEDVMDANNLKEEDIKKSGIKDFIKKKQEQTTEQKEVKKDVEPSESA